MPIGSISKTRWAGISLAVLELERTVLGSRLQSAMKLPGKPMKQGNLFAKIPADLSREVFDSLVESARVRIERIISRTHIA